MAYINKIYVSTAVKNNKYTQKILDKYESPEIVEKSPEELDHKNIKPKNFKEILFLRKSKGELVKGCPGTGKDYLCCRYQIINHTMNCPLNCSYCILQYYLDEPNTIYTDFDNIFQELDEKLNKQENRFFRVGTGELGDSAVLPGSRLFAKELMKQFADRDNLLLEFKTKSADIDDLLKIPSKKKAVISWSVNPEEIIAQEESKAAALKARLEAAHKAQENGFLIGFHFDPILEWDKWKEKYGEVVREIYNSISPSRIAWISLGSLRFPPETKEEIKRRYPDTDIVYSEMIRGHDNKLRYIRPLRVSIYKHIYNKLTEVDNPPFIYFCMENKTVWKQVMDFTPEDNAHLDYLFAKNLYERFDNVVKEKPQFKYYQDALDLDGTLFQE